MTTAILAAVAVTLIGLGVAIRCRRDGWLFLAAVWLFYGGLFVQETLLVTYFMLRVGA